MEKLESLRKAWEAESKSTQDWTQTWGTIYAIVEFANEYMLLRYFELGQSWHVSCDARGDIKTVYAKLHDSIELA